MARLLRYQRILPAHPGTGRMAQKAHPDVLLETMALAAHEDQAPAGSGRWPEDGDPAWRQQQKLLAHGTHAGDAASVEQHMAQGTGAAEHQGTVVQGSGLLIILVERANSLNRPLRTRMVGGVGAGS